MTPNRVARTQAEVLLRYMLRHVRPGQPFLNGRSQSGLHTGARRATQYAILARTADSELLSSSFVAQRGFISAATPTNRH